MRISEGVEWAVHCCTVLAFVPEDRAGVPAPKLAELHGVPPAYLAKTMQALTRAGICRSDAGPKGGYRLARPAAEISLLEITLAVDGSEPAFRCTEIRQRGPAAVEPACYTRRCGIAVAFRTAEDAWRDSLSRVSVADLCAALATSVEPRQLTSGAVWLQEVVNR
jgi:Rrf2 family protein